MKKIGLILSVIMLMFISALYADPPTPTVTPSYGQGLLFNTIGTNGTVYAVVNTSTTAFIGGSFDKVGRVSGPGAVVSYNDPTLNTAFPRFLGTSVNCACTDGAGGWYVGGNFSYVNGEPRGNLAHIYSNGSLDPVWKPTTDNTVRAILLFNSQIYIGGDFSVINGDSMNFKNFMASLDPASGTVEPISYNVNAIVRALAGFNGNVYAGGDFTSAGGTARHHIACFDNIGAIQSWNPDINGTVNAIAIDTSPATGDYVYVGGNFQTVNQGTTPVTRNCLASFPVSSPTVTAFDPNMNGSVNALVIAGSAIYTGGTFTSVNGSTPCTYAASFLLNSAGAAQPWAPQLDNSVNSIAFVSNIFIIAGNFQNVGLGFPGYSPVPYTIACDASGNNTNYSNPWDPNFDAPALVVVPDDTGSKLFIGGIFNLTNVRINQANAAAFDISTGNLTSWNPDPNGPVYAMAVTNSTVYLGGDFTKLNSEAGNHYRAAACDMGNGSPTTWNPNVNAPIRAICPAGNNIYLGGDFTQVNGTAYTRYYGVAVDPVDGTVATNWDPHFDYPVFTLISDGIYIYAGGAFTHSMNSMCSYAGAFYIIDGSLLPSNLGPNNNVNALDLISGNIYAAGNFNMDKSTARNHAGAVNNMGNLLPWDPNLDNPAYSICHIGTTVFIGGGFSTVNNSAYTIPLLASFDTNSGNAYSAWNPFTQDFVLPGAVMALSTDGTKIIAGGQFTRAGYMPAGNVIMVNGPSQVLPPTPTFTPGPGGPAGTPTPDYSASYVYPQPAQDSATFSFILKDNSDMKILIFDIAGNLAKEYDYAQGTAGLNEVLVDIPKLRQGPYYYIIKGKNASGKEVKCKLNKFIVKR